ncbi:MAG: fumarate hydratase [Thermaerobacter sp.]|nr:fumarate hydratase [Thermaerobacter sp.]
MSREIPRAAVVQAVADLFRRANRELGADMVAALEAARGEEASPTGRRVLEQILENARLARTEGLPMCQDTGFPVVFAFLGEDAHVDDLAGAVDEGIRCGTAAGYLRASVVRHPLDRVNTGDNTPALLHLALVAGDRLRLAVTPKGAGSENMSRLAMLRPADGEEGVVDFVVETVRAAGPNPCPPLVVGVGIGSNFEGVALLAKRALLRPVGEPSADPRLAALERRMAARVRDLGIGPAGFGGSVTALAVHAEAGPTHIASLPVAVNISCHATRHAEAVL